MPVYPVGSLAECHSTCVDWYAATEFLPQSLLLRKAHYNIMPRSRCLIWLPDILKLVISPSSPCILKIFCQAKIGFPFLPRSVADSWIWQNIMDVDITIGQVVSTYGNAFQTLRQWRVERQDRRADSQNIDLQQSFKDGETESRKTYKRFQRRFDGDFASGDFKSWKIFTELTRLILWSAQPSEKLSLSLDKLQSMADSLEISCNAAKSALVLPDILSIRTISHECRIDIREALDYQYQIMRSRLDTAKSNHGNDTDIDQKIDEGGITRMGDNRQARRNDRRASALIDRPSKI